MLVAFDKTDIQSTDRSHSDNNASKFNLKKKNTKKKKLKKKKKKKKNTRKRPQKQTELRHEKTCFLPMRKERHRPAVCGVTAQLISAIVFAL